MRLDGLVSTVACAALALFWRVAPIQADTASPPGNASATVSQNLRPSSEPPSEDDAFDRALDGAPSERVRAVGTAARVAARALPDDYRVPRLIDLAGAQIEASDIAGARETLADARRLALAVPHGTVYFDTAKVVKLRVQAGDDPAVDSIMKGGADDQLRPASYIVDALAELGRFDEALVLARSMHRAAPLAHVALEQCHAGIDGGQATLAAASVEARGAEPDRRSFAVIDIAAAFAACGDVDGAIGIINEFDRENSRSDVVNAVHRLIRAGDVRAARAFVAARPEIFSRLDTPADLISFADDQIAWGDDASARATLAKAYDAGPKGSGQLEGIFRRQLAVGAFDDALRTAEQFDHVNWPNLLLHVVAETARRHATADLERVVALTMRKIESIDDDRPAPGPRFGTIRARIDCFSRLAAILGRSGYIGEAREALGRAQQLQRGVADLHADDEAVGQIAVAQVAMDDSDGALATLASGRYPRHRSQTAYAGVAEEFARRAEVKLALDTLAKIDGGNDAMRRNVALRLIEAGDERDALLMARQIRGAGERFEVLFECLKMHKTAMDKRQ